jgi:hypothetical protein
MSNYYGEPKYGWLARKLRKWLNIGEYPICTQEVINLENQMDRMKDFTQVYNREKLAELEKAFPLKADVEWERINWGGPNPVIKAFVIGYKIECYEPKLKVITDGEEKIVSLSGVTLTKTKKRGKK